MNNPKISNRAIIQKIESSMIWELSDAELKSELIALKLQLKYYQQIKKIRKHLRSTKKLLES